MTVERCARQVAQVALIKGAPVCVSLRNAGHLCACLLFRLSQDQGANFVQPRRQPWPQWSGASSERKMVLMRIV
eukprot:3355424-Rhodomonas_salina.2